KSRARQRRREVWSSVCLLLADLRKRAGPDGYRAGVVKRKLGQCQKAATRSRACSAASLPPWLGSCRRGPILQPTSIVENRSAGEGVSDPAVATTSTPASSQRTSGDTFQAIQQ